ALPLAISLGGTQLTGDVQKVDVDRSADIEVTWTPTEGRADFWQVTLSEINGNTPIVRSSVIATTPSVRFDADLLSTNAIYTIHIRTNYGTPNAATGDFVTSELPRGSTGVYSTTFSVH